MSDRNHFGFTTGPVIPAPSADHRPPPSGFWAFMGPDGVLRTGVHEIGSEDRGQIVVRITGVHRVGYITDDGKFRVMKEVHLGGTTS